ncbi:hypothetical protein GTY86_35535 [Streptomyces sp. SID5770]|uniref:phage tail protein n=1 Tax=Streptomyces sp. SID5770 TaxID=2690308 RepID=UPI0013722101|nr:hypothetical protein [Streptomyces sp. SID5770]MZE53822.1 hypothetical protein [Streptomyces sp. SID5770]MZE56489.1 hypothetical protein [Streptomyces sp. SID5770]
MAANEAEVDLIVNAAQALPDLERQLSQIVRRAENGAPEVDVQASLAVQSSIAVMSTQLDQALRQVDSRNPTIDVEAALDAQSSLQTLRQDLDELTRAARSGGTDIVELEAQLDFPRSLAEVTESLRDLVADAEAATPDIEVNVDVDDREISRAERAIRALGRASVTTARGMGKLTAGVAALSLAVGGGVQTVGALVAALQQVAPAAAVGTSALLTQKLAAGTLKLAMIGVQDAIERAFDPELSPEEFHKSLKDLAPEARLFVDELHTMRRELRGVQQEVQNRVFRDFDGVLRGLSRSLGGVVTGALNRTADSLNRMGKNAATAATQMGQQGVLGQALKGATDALTTLEKVPARVVRSFSFLAAASSPALNRIATAVDDLSLKIQEKLQRAFESGALEDSIDQAVSSLAQLGTIIANFGGGVANIFSGLTQNGGGLFDILEKVSAAFERLTASREFQTILAELSSTAGVLVDNILPLIEEAFVQLAPVIQELAPVIRDFVTAIGPELIPVIQELGPLLVDLALLLKEQLPIAIILAQATLAALALVLNLVHDIMQKAVIPIVHEISEALRSDFVKSISNAVVASTDLAGIGQRFTDLKNDAVRSFDAINAKAAELARKLGEAFGRAVRQLIDAAIGDFGDFKASVVRVLSDLPGQMQSIGRDIVIGLATGLVSQIPNVIGIARDIASSVTSTIRSALDIRSPSKVMATIGRDTVMGYIQGLESMLPQVQGAVAKIAQLTTANITQLNVGSSVTGLTGIDKIDTWLPDAIARSATQPVVNVYVGNELLYQVINGQIRGVLTRRDRTISQGVRI